MPKGRKVRPHREVLCYFDGDSFAAIRAAMNADTDANPAVYILKGTGPDHGKFYVVVDDPDGDDTEPDDDDDDNEINVSHPCPGSPGCP